MPRHKIQKRTVRFGRGGSNKNVKVFNPLHPVAYTAAGVGFYTPKPKPTKPKTIKRRRGKN
jgi:hypothetical protein